MIIDMYHLFREKGPFTCTFMLMVTLFTMSLLVLLVPV